MGNCLKSPTSDDISLLHESQSDRASFGEGTEPDQEPPPPYQVGRVCVGKGGARSRGSSGRGRGGFGLSLPLVSVRPGLRGTDTLRTEFEGDCSSLPEIGGLFHLDVGMVLLSLSSEIRIYDYVPLAGG